jgi:hypothetical protein
MQRCCKCRIPPPTPNNILQLTYINKKTNTKYISKKNKLLIFGI